MEGWLAAFAGLFAYGKYLEHESKAERAREERERAIEALRARAERLQEAVDDMEAALRYDPQAHTEKQMEAARRRADRAEEALLLAEAGVGRLP